MDLPCSRCFLWLHAGGIPTTPASSSAFATEDTVERKTRSGSVLQFNIEDHGVFAMALMPMRAFSTARAAEVTALGRLHRAFAQIYQIKAQVTKDGQVSPLLDDLHAAYSANNLILKTYLTSAEGYRKHIATGTASDSLKDVLLKIHLPHFTWVTEISTVDSYNNASAGLRRIFGHSLIDATSSGREVVGLLALHLPGIVFLRDVNKDGPGAQRAIVIENVLLRAYFSIILWMVAVRDVSGFIHRRTGSCRRRVHRRERRWPWGAASKVWERKAA
jgi:hypothetical protein